MVAFQKVVEACYLSLFYDRSDRHSVENFELDSVFLFFRLLLFLFFVSDFFLFVAGILDCLFLDFLFYFLFYFVGLGFGLRLFFSFLDLFLDLFFYFFFDVFLDFVFLFFDLFSLIQSLGDVFYGFVQKL